MQIDIFIPIRKIRPQASGHRLQAASYRLQAAGYRPIIK